jgi:hypothetical protein
MIKLMPPPKLLDRRYLGRLAGLAEKLRAEEARAYIGSAEFPSQYRMMARLYLVMARRENFCWKLELSFQSAIFPGARERKLASQYYVRAGAIFGTLQFG